MAKMGDDDWGKVVLVILGFVVGGFIYYTQTGQGEENDSAAIPNDLERKIDDAVAALNRRFGKRWVEEGVQALRWYLGRVMPQTVALADILAAVELESRRRPMSSHDKQQTAGRMALNRRIG
jgi:hypothetical protein